MDDFPTTKFISDEVHHEDQENIYSHKHRIPFSSDTQEMGHFVCSPDYALENGNETEAVLSDPAETLTVCQDIKLSVNGSDKMIAGGSKREPAAANTDGDVRSSRDELMVESHQFLKSMPLNPCSVSAEDSSVPANTDGLTGSQRVSERIDSGSGTAKQAGNDMASGQHVSVAKMDSSTTIGTSSIPNLQKGKGITSEMDHESDTDEYPDLLNEDPDSDSNQEEEF